MAEQPIRKVDYHGNDAFLQQSIGHFFNLTEEMAKVRGYAHFIKWCTVLMLINQFLITTALILVLGWLCCCYNRRRHHDGDDDRPVVHYRSDPKKEEKARIEVTAPAVYRARKPADDSTEPGSTAEKEKLRS